MGYLVKIETVRPNYASHTIQHDCENMEQVLKLIGGRDTMTQSIRVYAEVPELTRVSEIRLTEMGENHDIIKRSTNDHGRIQT